MKKQILLSGLLGGVVILVWLIISLGPLQLSGDFPKPIPNDKDIHTALKEGIAKPGVYYCPDSSKEIRDRYPNFGNEPVFTIVASGRTPDAFLEQLIFEMVCIFGAAMIAAWLLSMASERVLARYSRRVFFVAVVGLFLAVCGDMFSDKPIGLILLSSLHHLITWILAGLVIAWRIKPRRHMPA